MNNWQDLADYIDAELSGMPFYKNYNMPISNLLNLANESLMGLTIDYVSFECEPIINPESAQEIEVTTINIPNVCSEVFRMYYDTDEIERLNAYEFENYCHDENEITYCVGDYKIRFSKPVLASKIEILGKGKFDLYTKNPQDDKVFKLLPVEFHLMPAYFVLQRLAMRAKEFQLAQYYLQLYTEMRKDYEWELVKRRCTLATFNPHDWTQTNKTDTVWKIYDKVTVEVTTVPSLSPTEIQNRIDTAINTLSNTVYNTNQVDTKVASAIQEAKNYTYSQDEINSKDTSSVNTSKQYTDTQVGTIEDALDEIIGEE